MGMYPNKSKLSYDSLQKKARYEAKHPNKVKKIARGGVALGAGAGVGLGMAKSGAAAAVADVVSDVVLAAVATPVAPIIKKAIAVTVMVATVALSAHFIHKKIENNKETDNMIYTEIPQDEPTYDPHRDGCYP